MRRSSAYLPDGGLVLAENRRVAGVSLGCRAAFETRRADYRPTYRPARAGPRQPTAALAACNAGESGAPSFI